MRTNTHTHRGKHNLYTTESGAQGVPAERTPVRTNDTSVHLCAGPAVGMHAESLQQRFPEVNGGLIKKDPSCGRWGLPSMLMVH